MIKKLNGYFLTEKVRHKYLVKVRSFSGTKVTFMVDHVKPTLCDEKPDHIILHAGTNDLRTEKTTSQTANKQLPICQYNKQWQFGNCVWDRTSF